ncbi:MAG TPA: 16S rRNA (uracil(1498)-N(3))-methyltransferase, partial [Janibacter terrae]|nr:16S rRNA (uracil(1498)-N(3))-methyltransferase [Janibacter terrae]
MTAPLFLVDPGALDGLGVDGVVDLTGPEAHHAATVVRLA